MTTIHEIRVRAPWHETGSGCWSLSLSGGGFTVRVTQRKPGAVFERIMVLSDGEQSWESLGTADRHVADQRAREFLRVLLETHAPVCQTVAASPDEVAAPARAAMVASTAEPVAMGAPTSNGATCPPPLTLARLWTLYPESEAFASLKEKTRGDYATAARILIASLGPDTEVTMLDQDALTGHENRRYAGGIEYTRISRKGSRGAARSLEVVTTKPARARAVGLDLQVLRLMLFWPFRRRAPTVDTCWTSFRCAARSRFLARRTPFDLSQITSGFARSWKQHRLKSGRPWWRRIRPPYVATGFSSWRFY